jgi:hypothetical protein
MWNQTPAQPTDGWTGHPRIHRLLRLPAQATCLETSVMWLAKTVYHFRNLTRELAVFDPTR